MSNQALKRVRRHLKMEVNRKPLDAFAWPGGYPLFYISHDCAAFCPACANKEIDRIAAEIASPDRHDQFRLIAVEVNYENDDLYCDHCNETIPSAYGDT